MARLQDFYQEGPEVLADVTFSEGEVVGGQKVVVPLSKPAQDDVDVTVLEQKGSPGQLDDQWNMRMKFNPYKLPVTKHDSFHSTENDDLIVQIKRNPSDTNSLNNYFPDFMGECRPAGGTWNNNHDMDGYIV